ncbi:hypothetical protein Tsubulata_007343 [Turnera subulata]|uniref:CW-type domain-containing protein n=1 Tax=Turnera subulata TaxID=218843 RepID=A0A9Q0FN02_9ROSI|nr:hypothetical protein Tsubulata_007343 [Turnera subulata]
MGTRICMNVLCGTTTSREWKRGWPMRSGGCAALCFSCGSAYENAVYCDTFHSDEPGWRECYLCNKRLHCGCIASKCLLELLDFGGVGCTACARIYHQQLMKRKKTGNGLSSLPANGASDGESIPVENKVTSHSNDEGKFVQLRKMIEANESNLLCPSDGVDTNACLGQFRQDEITHAVREIGPTFSNLTPSVGSSTFVKPDHVRPIIDMGDMHGSLGQSSLNISLGTPSGSTSFVAVPGMVVEGREQGQAPSFQQGQRSRPIYPKPLKPGVALSSESNKNVASEPRVARPPAEGRVQPLFEKVLSASDAGRIGRLVLPKACAEAYFPPISQSEGLPIRIQDVKGREWTFQFRFWPNNNSRMYVLEGVTPCIQSMQLQAGDTIIFSRIEPGGKLVVGYRKSANNIVDTQDPPTPAFHSGAASGETSFSAEGDTGWNNSENNGGVAIMDQPQQSPVPAEKKRARNIGSKCKRLLIHNEDAMELRLTWEEAQELLRPPPSVKPNIITIDDHEFEEYDEPPVFGKRTIFLARPSGGQEQWAQCDDCSKWRKLPVDALLPPKWRCLDNVWDSTRNTCSAPEEMSPRDLENLLRVCKDFKKRRTTENRKTFEECEPSGLDALASAAVLGDKIGETGESSVGATTKHPRHRPGCTCIVCIQPPSGKGKHKSSCMCTVCMTVRRRFKTLMMKRRKRQSEREAEYFQKEKDEAEANGSLSKATPCMNNLDNEGNNSRKQTDLVSELSSGRIDLNSHPNREDAQPDVPGLSLMSLVDAATQPLDDLVKENGITSSSLMQEQQQGSLGSCLLAQNNGDSLRGLSHEAFLASMGWDHDNRND